MFTTLAREPNKQDCITSHSGIESLCQLAMAGWPERQPLLATIYLRVAVKETGDSSKMSQKFHTAGLNLVNKFIYGFRMIQK